MTHKEEIFRILSDKIFHKTKRMNIVLSYSKHDDGYDVFYSFCNEDLSIISKGKKIFFNNQELVEIFRDLKLRYLFDEEL
jgi:hypothetical protein